jgi:hypothetical protein
MLFERLQTPKFLFRSLVLFGTKLMQFESKNLSLRLFLMIWIVSSFTYLCLTSTAGPSKVLTSLAGLDLFPSLLYLFSCVALTAFGISIANPTYSKKSPNISNYRKLAFSNFKRPNQRFSINPLLVYISAFLIIITGILVFKESGFTGDLESQRTSYLAALQEVSLISYLSQFSQSLAIIACALIPWLSNLSLKTKGLLLGLIFVGCILFSLSNGGRIAVFSCCIQPFLVSIAVGNYDILFDEQRKKRTLLYILGFGIAVLLLLICFSTFQYYRSKSFVDIAFGLTMKPYSDFVEALGIGGDTRHVISFCIYIILDYLSNGIQFFPHFFQVYQPHPLLGAYQFNFISSRLPDYDWVEWKNEVENSYRYFGLYWNVWGSYVRDYVVDFGKIWSPLFCFFTGILIGAVESRSTGKSSFLVLYIILVCWIIMSPYYSLLLFRPFHIAIILVVGWIIVEYLSHRKNLSDRLKNM